MNEKSTQINSLLDIMRQLRDPESGCPWDIKQDFQSIAPYTIEEAYEVQDAIQNGDKDGIKQELGDLLFQVVFHSQMAEEQQWFDFNDVVLAICDKLYRRHPHVFADEKITDAEQQTRAWEQHKLKERAEKHNGEAHSVLEDIPVNLPALIRAVKMQKRAALQGFDWPDVQSVFPKIEEEIEEVKEEMQHSNNQHRILDEVGDVLFAVTNLARHLNIDPEAALRHANSKFEQRYRKLEQNINNSGKVVDQLSLHELEIEWAQVKTEEKI